jgi:hypothetical protein
MKIGMKKTVEVEAKTLRIHTKVRDMFQAYVLDQDGQEIGGQDDGYVPKFMPEDHYGDYLILNIDIETGQITNWKKPTQGQIEEFIGKNKEDDEG